MQAEKSYDTLPNFTAADCKYVKRFSVNFASNISFTLFHEIILQTHSRFAFVGHRAERIYRIDE